MISGVVAGAVVSSAGVGRPKSAEIVQRKYMARHHKLFEKPVGYPTDISETCLGFEKEFWISNLGVLYVYNYARDTNYFGFIKSMFRISHLGYRFGISEKLFGFVMTPCLSMLRVTIIATSFNAIKL